MARGVFYEICQTIDITNILYWIWLSGATIHITYNDDIIASRHDLVTYEEIHSGLLFFSVICQISRSHETKKLQILTQIEHFQTVTPVWIHWWLWNDAQSLTYYRRDTLLIFKVIHQISGSHRTKKSPILTQIEHFRTVTPVWIHRWLWNHIQSLMYYRSVVLLISSKSSIKFQSNTGWKIDDLNPFLSKITRPVAAIKPFIFALLVILWKNVWMDFHEIFM